MPEKAGQDCGTLVGLGVGWALGFRVVEGYRVGAAGYGVGEATGC